MAERGGARRGEVWRGGAAGRPTGAQLPHLSEHHSAAHRDQIIRQQAESDGGEEEWQRDTELRRRMGTHRQAGQQAGCTGGDRDGEINNTGGMRVQQRDTKVRDKNVPTQGADMFRSMFGVNGTRRANTRK